MNVCILYNPKAGSAGLIAALRHELAGRVGLCLVETTDADDLRRKAAETARGGCDLLAVAGGDGTLHAVVNALGPDFPATPLAVLPLGTGNDFCRTLGVPLDPLPAADLFPAGERRGIDVVRVEGAACCRFAINAVTGGFSGRVAADVTGELKGFWGPLAYLRGALGTVIDPPRHRLTVRFDGGPAEVFDALNLVVANGRTAAGGLSVAPRANPEDGLLDVVIVRSGDTLDLSIVAARLMEGDYLDEANVLHRRARRVEIASDPPLPVSIDGEPAEGPRFVFEVVPRALRFVVGPGYVPAPEPPPADPDDDEPADSRPRTVRQRVFGLLSGVLSLGGRVSRLYALGLVLALAAAGGFARLATTVHAGEWDAANKAVYRALRTGGEDLSPAALERSPPAEYVAAVALTRVGDILGMVVIGGAVVVGYVARRRYLDATTLVVIMAGSGLLEAVLKAIFRIARPDAADRLDVVTWYSFPSGHALRGVALYGGLAVLLVTRHPHAWWRWAVAAGLCLLAAGICWSRLYLGVHWLTDVIGGVLAAVCWVTCCLLARHSAHRRLTARRPPP